MCVGATPIIMVVGRQEVGFLVESISIHEGGCSAVAEVHVRLVLKQNSIVCM